MFTDEKRREFIKHFEGFPDQVIATALTYEVSRFGRLRTIPSEVKDSPTVIPESEGDET